MQLISVHSDVRTSNIGVFDIFVYYLYMRFQTRKYILFNYITNSQQLMKNPKSWQSTKFISNNNPTRTVLLLQSPITCLFL